MVSRSGEAASLHKLAELTFYNDSLNVFDVCTLLVELPGRSAAMGATYLG